MASSDADIWEGRYLEAKALIAPHIEFFFNYLDISVSRRTA